MILIFILALSPLNVRAFEKPSYRSSVMEGSRPILRMKPEEPQEEDTLLEGGVNPNTPMIQAGLDDEKMAKDLSLLVAWLLQRLGYNFAKDVSKINGIVEYNKLAKRRDNSFMDYVYGMFRGKGHQTEPAWVMDLKDYVAGLVSQYGPTDLEMYTRPVIKYIQKNENVMIKDIDVGKYGEVFVSYKNKTKNHIRTDDEETQYNSGESDEPVERVTEMLQRRIFVKK